jgi:hypothetical protein
MLLEYSLEEAIRCALDWGYAQVEVWGDYPHAHPDLLDAAERRALRQLLRPFERLSLRAPLGGAGAQYQFLLMWDGILVATGLAVTAFAVVEFAEGRLTAWTRQQTLPQP